MLTPKNFTSGFAVTMLLITLSGCATNAQLQLSEADATCKQARSGANFLQQLASSDGGTDPNPDAPVSRACKTMRAKSVIGSGTT